MNKRTLKALKGSIIKWHLIRYKGGVDQGGDNCPLCKIFSHDWGDDACKKCPVYAKTRQVGCQGTAYEDFSRHGSPTLGPVDMIAKTPLAKDAAKEMLHELVDLLPKDESCVTDDGWEYFPAGYTG